MEKNNKPIHKIRFGAVVAAVWENETQDGTKVPSITLERLYKRDDDWRSSSSLSRNDLPNAVKALDAAHTYLVAPTE